MGTIPTPPTIATLEFATSAKINQLRDCVNFWSLTPRCFAYRNGAVNIANYTANWTVCGLDAEVYDIVQSGDTASHDNTTTNERIFIRTSGKYELVGAAEFGSNATGFRSAMIRKNSAGSDTGGTLLVTNTQGAVNGAITSIPLPAVEEAFTAGDYIELFVRQNSGGSLALGVGRAQTFMRMKQTGT